MFPFKLHTLKSIGKALKCVTHSLMFQRFSSPPTIFVTATHGVTNRTQDAMAMWVEDLKVGSFKICLREAKIFDGPHKNLKIVSNPEFYKGCRWKIY